MSLNATPKFLNLRNMQVEEVVYPDTVTAIVGEAVSGVEGMAISRAITKKKGEKGYLNALITHYFYEGYLVEDYDERREAGFPDPENETEESEEPLE